MSSPRTMDAEEQARRLEEKRLKEARALVAHLEQEHGVDTVKVCVMLRVRRLFDVSMSDQSFQVMLHVITCWRTDGDAANDALSAEFCKEHEGQFVYDADPDIAFYEPDFRPSIAIRNLGDGSATLKGGDGEDFFFRAYVDGCTLVTWEVEKLCKIGTLFDLIHYPVRAKGLPCASSSPSAVLLP